MIDWMNADRWLWPLGLTGIGMIVGGLLGTVFGVVLANLMKPWEDES